MELSLTTLWTIVFIGSALGVAALILLYVKREEDEKGLGWKLFGFYYIGIIGLFLKPDLNKRNKRIASILGIFLLVFVILSVNIANKLENRVRVIEQTTTNEKLIDYDNFINEIEKGNKIKGETRIERYRFNMSNDFKVSKGEIAILSSKDDEIKTYTGELVDNRYEFNVSEGYNSGFRRALESKETMKYFKSVLDEIDGYEFESLNIYYIAAGMNDVMNNDKAFLFGDNYKIEKEITSKDELPEYVHYISVKLNRENSSEQLYFFIL